MKTQRLNRTAVVSVLWLSKSMSEKGQRMIQLQEGQAFVRRSSRTRQNRSMLWEIFQLEEPASEKSLRCLYSCEHKHAYCSSNRRQCPQTSHCARRLMRTLLCIGDAISSSEMDISSGHQSKACATFAVYLSPVSCIA